MTAFARIDAGVVAEIISITGDPSLCFHPDLVKDLVACGQNVAPGYLYANGAFALPPPLPQTAPNSVALWQARAQMKVTPYAPAGGTATTLFAAMDGYVDGQSTANPALWEAWNMGNTVSRAGLVAATLTAQFSVPTAAIDQLFIAANAIQG